MPVYAWLQSRDRAGGEKVPLFHQENVRLGYEARKRELLGGFGKREGKWEIGNRCEKHIVKSLVKQACHSDHIGVFVPI